jgi:hypothetical protein
VSDISEITRLGKRHLQGQQVGNRDRFDALMEGWHAIIGAEEDPRITFYEFQAGVEAFERVLAERSLDRQYAYERSRRQAENDYRAEQDAMEKRDRFAFETPLGDAIEGE